MIFLCLILLCTSALSVRAYLSASRRERALLLLEGLEARPDSPEEGGIPIMRALKALPSFVRTPRGGVIFVISCSLLLALLTANPLLAVLPWPVLKLGRHLYERRREEAVRRRKEEQVTEFIDSLSQSLRSGLSLQQSLETCLDDVGAEMRREVQGIIDGFRLGGGLEGSLLNAAEATDLPSLRLVFLVTGLLHGRGGDLPLILQRLRKRVAEGIELRRELRTLTSQSRASAYLVSALPALFLVLQASLNPGSLRPLLSSPTGNVVLLAALSLDAAAFLIMRKLLGREA